MRTIDADALKRALRSIGQHGESTMWAAGFDTAIGETLDLVDAAPPVTPSPRWIPAAERLPEEDGYVLVAHSNGFVCICAFWTDCGAYYFSVAEITHWMPLPAPPEVTP